MEGDVPVKIFGLNIPKWLVKPNSTIQPISVGIVAEDGREYYAISKEFNLKEAWNRYDLVEKKNRVSYSHFHSAMQNVPRKNVGELYEAMVCLFTYSWVLVCSFLK